MARRGSAFSHQDVCYPVAAFLAFSIIAILPVSAPADEPPAFRVEFTQPFDDPQLDEPELDPLAELEQLLRQPVIAPALEQQVTSVSRQESTVGRSAAAVYVVTQDMIRRSGVTSVPEALRMVPGLQVARIDSNKWAISSRGFNNRFANKTKWTVAVRPPMPDALADKLILPFTSANPALRSGCIEPLVRERRSLLASASDDVVCTVWKLRHSNFDRQPNHMDVASA